jgi:flagellar biosynthetic protein FliP
VNLRTLTIRALAPLVLAGGFARIVPAQTQDASRGAATSPAASSAVAPASPSAAVPVPREGGGRSHGTLPMAKAGASVRPASSGFRDVGGFTAPLNGSGEVSETLRIALLFTALALLPTILLMMTSFVRMVIVFHFVRQALGTQTTPPNQVLLGLALFLTFFVMYPTGKRVYEDAVVPFESGQTDVRGALDAASAAPREWMLKNTREKDLMLFVSMAHIAQPKGPQELPMHVVIPSFVISELRASFQIGFLIFLPFLVIDLVVSAVLLSSGMMMLPPVVVSFPFKILLFVMVDGWYLLVGSLVKGFH